VRIEVCVSCSHARHRVRAT